MRLDLRHISQPDDRFPFAHASALALDMRGRLTCFWFSGSLEGHADVMIRAAMLSPDAARASLAAPSWSAPITVVDAPGQPAANPLPHLNPEGGLELYFVTFPPRAARRSRLLRQTSRDRGATWSGAESLTDAPGYWPRHPIIQHSGRWLLPLCNVAARPPVSMVWVSRDSGTTWDEVAIPRSEGLIQPCLVKFGDGELHCYLRDMSCTSVRRSVSFDGGLGWSRPEATRLPNNNAGISLLALGDGGLLAAYHDTTIRSRRSRIAVAWSPDRGRSWPHRRLIVPFDDVHAAKCQYSYPFLLEDSQGLVHMSLTWRSSEIVHVCLDQEWVAADRARLVVPPAELYARPPYDVRRLHPGEPIYMGDKVTELRNVPDKLVGCLAICPANLPGMQREPDEQSFFIRLNRPAIIVVAVSGRSIEPPMWLRDFRRMPEKLETSEGPFDLFCSSFSSGEHFLGDRGARSAPGQPPWFAFLIEDADRLFDNHNAASAIGSQPITVLRANNGN